jgi:hypothetical protein
MGILCPPWNAIEKAERGTCPNMFNQHAASSTPLTYRRFAAASTAQGLEENEPYVP